MAETSQIRTSLMKIKESQNSLLKQLRSEHDALQGYITSNIDFGENLNEFRPNGVGFCNDYRSYDSSLQFTKSEGNMVGYQNYGYGSTSAGADDVLENNYKKIQDLLMKQRKLFEQNHALQEENQSLIEDYRSMKSLFYKQKQTNTDNLVVSGQIFNTMYQVTQNLLLQNQNNQILFMAKKGWEKFKASNDKLFQESLGNFSEQCESYLNRVFMLLDQEFKVNKMKNKDQEIEQLKLEMKRLIEGNEQKQREMEREREKLEEILVQNKNLSDLVEELKKKMIDDKSANVDRINKIETEILQKKRQVSEFTTLLLKKNDEIDQIKKSSKDLKSFFQTTEMEQVLVETKLSEVSKELMKKQQLYQQQVELSKKQNQMIERMNIDMGRLQKQLQALGMRRGQNENRLLIDNQGLVRELNGLKVEFGRYRQNTQREINLLMFQNKQIKNQHHMLLRSEQNARLNEQRIRQMSASRVSSMKLSTNIGHLWSVKQIEYQNILKILMEGR